MTFHTWAHPLANDACILLGVHQFDLTEGLVPSVVRVIRAGDDHTPTERRTVVRDDGEGLDAFRQRVIDTIRVIKAEHSYDHTVSVFWSGPTSRGAAWHLKDDAEFNTLQVCWLLVNHERNPRKRAQRAAKFLGRT